MTATRLATAGGGGASSVPTGWFNVKDYGATGDGVTDDTASINSAITAANVTSANASTIYFPPGTYIISSTLSFASSNGTRLLGSGGRIQFQYGPTIQYTPATGSAITTYHSTGFTMEGIRVRASSTSHNGDLIDMGAVGGDTQQFQIRNCAITTSGPSASLVRMNYTIIGAIYDCHFGGSVTGIKVGDGNYCVNVQIRDNTFNCGRSAGDYAIWTREGSESILIQGNGFEAQAGNYAGAWKHTGGVAWQITFDDNWMGDNSLGTDPWILVDGGGNLFSFAITNNRFTNATNAFAISNGTTGQMNSGQISGNYFDNAPLKAGGAEVWIYGNKLCGSMAACTATYVQGSGTNAGSFNAGSAQPLMGFGLSSGVVPQYGLDVKAGTDHRALRLQSGFAYFGGTEGAQDANLGFRANGTYGFEVFGGEGATGINNTGLLLNRTNSDFAAPTDAGVLYTLQESAVTRFKVRDGGTNGSAYMGRYLRGTATWNPASVANGAITTTTVTVAAAVVGDPVAVGFPLLVATAAAPVGLQLTGQVTATNTVTVVLRNDSGGAVDLDSGTLVAHVWKH